MLVTHKLYSYITTVASVESFNDLLVVLGDNYRRSSTIEVNREISSICEVCRHYDRPLVLGLRRCCCVCERSDLDKVFLSEAKENLFSQCDMICQVS